MYVKDEAADAFVARNERIQDAVQGRSVMLLVPGHMAGVAVNACLMFGWMGSLIGAYHLFPILQVRMGWYLLAISVSGCSLATFWTMILRGHRRGRSLMHWFALVSLAIAMALLGVALSRTDRIGAWLVASGFTFVVIGQRLIAGSSYARFTAFFRAKRTYELSTSVR